MAEEAKKEGEDVAVDPAEEAETATPEKTDDETIGDIIGEVEPEHKETAPKGDDSDTTQTVPLATFLQLKKEHKAEVEELKRNGASAAQIDAEIKAIAEELGTDPEGMDKFAKALTARVTATIDAKNAPAKAKERMRAINEAFATHFSAAMERMPEYKEIVKPDVIKALSLLPENAKKTFPQLIEETYGAAITGKRTIEPIQPGGGKEPAALDFQKARQDTEYFKQVMANPKLKAEYNKKMLEVS